MRRSLAKSLLLAVLTATFCAPAGAQIRFGVQPIIDREATRKAFQPLADYIAKAAGRAVELRTAYDYADYWLALKAGKYDLALDAAIYVDWRIKRQGHVPLVKVPGMVSYSLVAPSTSGLLEPGELIGKRIASLIPPAPGGLVMAQLFPNPVRQPYVQPVKSSEEALQLLLAGKVQAAMIPTPLAAQAMAQGKDINTIVTSEQTPHITLTAAPSVDEAVRERIKQALLDAANSPEGREMLKRVGFEGFEPAPAGLYDGYIRYLDQEWAR
jgi:phosphonate transport system substrate-binding protein